MEEGWGDGRSSGRPAPALTEAGGCRDRHTVTVGVGADGWFQAAPVALLILAGEAHQGVGCREGRGSCRWSLPVGPPALTQRSMHPLAQALMGPLWHAGPRLRPEGQGHQILALEGLQ